MPSDGGVQNNAMNAAKTAQGQAGGAYNQLNPIYAQMANNPQGFTSQQKANMLGASAQSLGGSMSAATGQANLATARTGNIGGYSAGLDDAARSAGVTQSQNAMGVENQDAALQRQQQSQGLDGLNGLYHGASSTGQGYLNTAEDAQKNNFLKQITMQAMSNANKAMTAGAGG
jgi:hypothetical protein